MFKFNRSQKGQGLFEYALILVLVAVVVIVVLQVLGPLVGNVFSDVNDGLGGGAVVAGEGGGGEEVVATEPEGRADCSTYSTPSGWGLVTGYNTNTGAWEAAHNQWEFNTTDTYNFWISEPNMEFVQRIVC